MAADWETALDRWVSNGLIDGPTEDRIRAFESASGSPRGFRWPVILALTFGGVAIGAGVLLFVSAHWDEISPGSRLSLVVLMVTLLHGSGAVASERFPALAATLHGLGTVALGAGIALTGQIFNLAEHWPSGTMLWAAGAWVAWAFRRDMVQLILAALLTPAWVTSEWVVAVGPARSGAAGVLMAGLLLLAFAYMGAATATRSNPVRTSLVVIGAVALFPCTLYLAVLRESAVGLSPALTAIGWAVAIGAPALVMLALRGKTAWVMLPILFWVLVLNGLDIRKSSLLVHVWCAVGAVGLTAWGIQESRTERINLGTVGFALTVVFFYFSNLMDKLGRAASLVGLGLLFLAGGWVLERVRRRLVAQVKGVRP